MKIIFTVWLAILSVVVIVVMFQVMQWTDRVVEQARINASQQTTIRTLEEAVKTNQQAVLGILQFLES